MSWLKQSTAASCIVGPILDSAGAEYASAVIGDLSISKNGGTLTALASAATLTYISNGMYTLAITTGNTDTVGRVEISCNKSTYQMPHKNLLVLLASVFDALVTNATNGTGGLIAATAAVSAVAGYVGSSGAAINGTNANTLSSHDPGATLGTSTLTQTQVSGGAYALNSASFAFNTAMDFTSTQKTSLDAATPSVTVGDKTGFSLANGSIVTATFGVCDFTSTQKTSITTSATAATPTVTAGTVSDKTGYSLAANQHVIVDSGTVTTLTNLPSAPTDWLSSAAVSAAAVTKVQSGLSTYAGEDTAGTTTLLGRIASSITISGGKVAATIATGDFADISAVRAAKIDNLDAAVSTRGTSTLTQTQVTGGTYALNDASFAFNAAMDFTTTQKAATLAGVTTVTTTTDLTNLPAVTANWLTGTGIAASGVTKIQAGLATSDQLNSAVWAQTRFRFSIPEAVEVPESGTATYTLGITTYDASGALTDLDSSPTIHAYYANGTSADALLSAVTNVATGEYTIVLSVANGTTSPQFLRFVGSGAMSSVALGMTDYLWIVDNVAEGFTAGDRGNLDAIFDKLPVNSIADEALVLADTAELLSRVVNNGYGVLADLTGIAGHPVAVDTGTAGTISFLSGEYVATTSGTFNANVTQINGETVHDDGDGRFDVMDVVLDAAQPNDITFTGTITVEPTTMDATALLLRGNGTGRGLDIYSPNGHAVTMYAGLNAFDIYAQGNAIYAQSNTSDAVVLYAGGDANGLHIYGGQSSGSAVKLQTNGVGCGLEVLSGGEGFAAHIGGMKIDGVVTLETGLIITQSTASAAAVQIVGNGSGPGLDIQGGEYSDGIRARSGASYGYGFCVAGAQGGSRMWSTGANGTGLTLTGAGTGDGMLLNPGDTGSGLHIYGGVTSGDAVHVETSGSGSVYFPIDGSGITIGDVTLAADQHVIVDSGTVTTLSNLPTAPTNWLTAAAVNADAVTKIQAGLATPTNITAGTITNLTNAPTVGDFTAAMKTSLNSATPQNTNILAIKEKTDQFRFTVANQVDANALTGGVPEPSGARTVTITVDDGTDPLENAVVRLTSGATTWRKITDPDGLAIFSIDDATWEVSVTRGSDYTGITDTLVVADDVAETYSLDAISFTPSTPPEITAYLTAIDNNGIIQSGVDVSIQYVKPYGTGTAFDGTLRTETSDVNGLVQFTGLVVGATYRLSRGASRRHPISVHIPTDATSPYALPSIVGDS